MKHYFENWAQIFSVYPEVIYSPSSQDEIITIISDAQKSNKRIRVFGAGHSPSDIACCDDIMINLDNYSKVLSLDLEHNLITVQSGIRLHELNTVLATYGLALPVLGSIDEQSIAGVLSTATHGSSRNYGCISTCVEELAVVTGNKEIVRCSRSMNRQFFKASLCSLGALGVISEVTLRVKPAFQLKKKEEAMKLEDVLHNLIKLRHHEYMRFHWYPHTDDAIVWHARKVYDQPVQRTKKSKLNCFIGHQVLEAAYWAATYVPSLIPLINRIYYSLNTSHLETEIDKSTNIFKLDCLFKQYVTEWAIPVEHTEEALRALKMLIKESNLKVHFPIEVRFVKKDKIWLSPAYERDVCYIGIIMYRPFGKEPGFQDYFTAFENLMETFEGRPHWAKVHKWNNEKCSDSYPMWQEFRDLCEEHDPECTFHNDYIKRIFS